MLPESVEWLAFMKGKGMGNIGDDYSVSVGEAIGRLAVVEDYDPGDGPKPCVHAIVETAFGMLGAHWSVEKARQLMEECGVATSGPSASAMGHGLVTVRENGPIFWETRSA